MSESGDQERHRSLIKAVEHYQAEVDKLRTQVRNLAAIMDKRRDKNQAEFRGAERARSQFQVQLTQIQGELDQLRREDAVITDTINKIETMQREERQEAKAHRAQSNETWNSIRVTLAQMNARA